MRVAIYSEQIGVDLGNPETDYRTAAICAGLFLQDKAKARGEPRLEPDSSDEACALAAWSYNGRAYGSYRASPYVSNDPLNGVRLRIVGTVPQVGKPWLRLRINRVDPRPGVLPVMRELKVRLGAAVTPTLPAALEAHTLDLNGRRFPLEKARVVSGVLYAKTKPEN